MSKSKGNVVDPKVLVDKYGVDSIRYFLLREIAFGQDGNFTNEALINRINSDLANDLGNLLSRTVGMIDKYFKGILPSEQKSNSFDSEIINTVQNTVKKVEEYMEKMLFSDAFSEIWVLVRRCNKYIDETTPWILAKDESKKERLATVLYNLLESIRSSAILLQAFLPDTADEIFRQLNTNNRFIDSIEGFNGLDIDLKLNEPKPLFLRIDKEEKLKQVENL